MDALDRKILEAGRRAAVKHELLAPHETPLMLEYAEVTDLRDSDGRRPWLGRPIKVFFGAVADRMFFCDRAGTIRLGTHLAMLTDAKLSFSKIEFSWLEREDVGVGATLNFPIKPWDDAERVFEQLKALRDEVWRGIPRSLQVDLINRVGDMGMYFHTDAQHADAAKRSEKAFILGEIDAVETSSWMHFVTTDLLLHPGYPPLADEPIHPPVIAEAQTDNAAGPQRRRPAPKRR